MNNIWSKYVQGTNTLYSTRKLRFNDMFAQKYGNEFIKTYDKPHINLTKIVEKQLKDCGVTNIVQSNICTFCNNNIYYSYRGDNHKTGSLISIMALKG